MNWGYRMMLVYLLFVGGMVTMAVLSFNQPLDMENENYYEAEKDQDARMHQRKMGNAFRPLIKIEQTAEKIVFHLPTDITEKQGLEGVVKWTRPSDSKLDFSVSFNEIKAGDLSLDKHNVKTGFWKYTMEWSHAYGHYLIEDTITVH